MLNKSYILDTIKNLIFPQLKVYSQNGMAYKTTEDISAMVFDHDLGPFMVQNS